MRTLKDWAITLLKVIVSPKPKTFEDEAEKAYDKTTSGIILLEFSYILFYIFTFGFRDPIFDIGRLILICLVAPFSSLLPAYIANAMLRRGRRDIDFSHKLVYLFLANVIVVTLLLAISNLLLLGLWGWILYAYLLILFVLCIKGVAGVRWARATGIGSLSFILFLFADYCGPTLVAGIGGYWY